MRTKARKLIWSAPLVAVFAVVGALAILVALAPNLVLAQSAMTGGSKPVSFMVTATTDGSISLSWAEPSDMPLTSDTDDEAAAKAPVLEYRIDVSMDGGNRWEVLSQDNMSVTDKYTSTGDTADGTHIELKAGTTYHYRVFAVYECDGGCSATTVELISPSSDVISGTTKGDVAGPAPTAPTGFTAMASGRAMNIGATRIELMWDTADAVELRIEYSMDVTPRSWMTLAEGLDSSTVASPSKAPYGPNDGMSGNHNGLMADTTYYYRIFAVNDADVDSLPVGAAARTNKALMPDAPQNLVAMGGPGNITLLWDAPMDPYGAKVSGYKVEYSDSETEGFTTLRANTGSSATSYVHDGLDEGDASYYRVSALNSAGTSTATSNLAYGVAKSATGTSKPATPTGLTVSNAVEVAVTDVTTAEQQPGQLKVSWTAVTTGVDHHRLQYSLNGEDGTWMTLAANTKTAPDASDASPYRRLAENSGLHVGLSGNTTYYYRVYAVKDSRASDPSVTAIGTTAMAIAPVKPTMLSATAVGTQINLSWKAPMDPPGAPVTGYLIHRMKGDGDWFIVTRDTGNTAVTYSDRGLDANTVYTYQVAAINGASGLGRSPFSDTDSATTGAGVVDTTLGEPTITSATVGTGSVTVAWTDGTNAVSHMTSCC